MRSQPTAKPHTRPVWPAPLAGVIALILYARTLAPGLTWAHHAADGGDLLAAALVGGVPHPSGYPTYQLLLRAAIALFPGEPARAGNWLSALCAAVAVGLFADLAGRMLVRMVSITPALSAVAALAAALTWAVSPTFWGQAVVTEVYTLNALAVVALLWLLWRWREAIDAGARGSAWLAGAGAVLGFGLGNHLSLLLMLPGAATWLWDGRKPAGGSLGRGLLAALGAAVVALGVYAYLPLMAAAAPPVNWEDPRTPQALWALVSGRLYRGLIFGLPAEHLPDRLLAWASEAVRQFGGPWAALVGAGRAVAPRPPPARLVADDRPDRLDLQRLRHRLQLTRFVRLLDPGLVRDGALVGGGIGLAAGGGHTRAGSPRRSSPGCGGSCPRI